MSDKSIFSFYINSKSNKSHEVKFTIAISKNPEPISSKNWSTLSHQALLPPKKFFKLPPDPLFSKKFLKCVFFLPPARGEKETVQTMHAPSPPIFPSYSGN